MTVRVCTGFSPAGRAEYGDKFLSLFAAHWPKEVELLFYTEEPTPSPVGQCLSIWDCAGARAFADRHRGNLAAHGRAEVPGWRPKDRDRGYSYRFDAMKFFKQMVIPAAAMHGLEDGDILVWLDADVMTLKAVPGEFIERLVGASDLVYLGRRAMHSEIGFWAVRVSHSTRGFVNDLAAIYIEDKVFKIQEWHSAFIFDHVRREWIGLNERNLTPNGFGHVWFMSPLAEYTDHVKGKRKSLGYSPEGKRA